MLRLLLAVVFARLAACLPPDITARITKSPVQPEGKLWAVLVAGSNGWDNYRHQADVCHAYQILHNHGIPDERIVVMMYDDIAYSKDNPTPGIILNHPNGHDVYHGVPRDYTGYDVTPHNLLNVLLGAEDEMRDTGSGKVIKSGPNDHVFFYFADHGGPGVIGFPETSTGILPLLGARQLTTALKKMHEQKKFKKMVIYIDACESGSMFYQLLPENIDIYATTAANPTEYSYATYYDGYRKAFLGDVYSVNWMEDSDKENITEETLQKQFEIVKTETRESHVQEYGELSIGKMHVSEFQGRKESRPIPYKPFSRETVLSRNVPLEILKRRLMATSGEEKDKVAKQLKTLLKNREFVDNIVKRIVKGAARNDEEVHYALTKKQEISNFDCYEEAVNHFHHECFNLDKNQYVLGKLYVLVNLCEKRVPVEAIMNAMKATCTHPPVRGIQ